MQKFLSTINDVKKINKAKKMISDESKKNIINTNEEKYEEEKNMINIKRKENEEEIITWYNEKGKKLLLNGSKKNVDMIDYDKVSIDYTKDL